ncbi:MAG: ABC transporter ATP-binding protein [Phycisphaerales bacterium]|nr:ABC transporter ATP-binding protein [Phycisphaerales bacterium]MCB9864350.1 ABC transporter ATP-binding protein [Phycisphaerales bacterium]
MTQTRRAPVRVEKASRVFQMGDVEVPALIDADLDVGAGDFVVVLGPSGSGKSTLLNLIGGLDRPTSGRLWFRDQELTTLSDDALTRYRREAIGFVFQFYNLVPTLTALENVQVATELVDDAVDPAEALAVVGLADRASHFPAQLSGGEQQRVSIARALAKRPDLLLADEPTGALDIDMARNVLGTLQRLNREKGLTIMLITHNPALASIANRIVRLVSGRIAEVTRNAMPAPASEIAW